MVLINRICSGVMRSCMALFMFEIFLASHMNAMNAVLALVAALFSIYQSKVFWRPGRRGVKLSVSKVKLNDNDLVPSRKDQRVVLRENSTPLRVLAVFGRGRADLSARNSSVGFFMFIFRFVDIETFLQRDICLSSPFLREAFGISVGCFRRIAPPSYLPKIA